MLNNMAIMARNAMSQTGGTGARPAGGSKGGAQVATPNPAPNAPGVQNTFQPQAQSGAPNVYNQSAGAYNSALGNTQQAMQGPNIGRFANPFTSMVTGQSLNDLERQRQMATNTMGAQATQAGAFGGSRHGVAEGATNEGFARQGANMFANLNNQGFNTALGAAQNQQNLQMQGAGQMGQLAGQGFGFGQQIAGQQAQQGGLQQGMQQMLIDAARNQYGGWAGSPQASLQPGLAATGVGGGLGEGTSNQTQTNSSSPGLFDYLSLGATAMGASDERLKKNIKPAHKIKDVQFYDWDWTDEAKEIVGDQGTHGVIANELQETYPDLVMLGSDGFLRVDYAALERELK